MIPIAWIEEGIALCKQAETLKAREVSQFTVTFQDEAQAMDRLETMQAMLKL